MAGFKAKKKKVKEAVGRIGKKISSASLSVKRKITKKVKSTKVGRAARKVAAIGKKKTFRSKTGIKIRSAARKNPKVKRALKVAGVIIASPIDDVIYGGVSTALGTKAVKKRRRKKNKKRKRS